MNSKYVGLFLLIPLLLVACASAQPSSAPHPSRVPSATPANQIPYPNPCTSPPKLAYNIEAAAQFPFEINASADQPPSLIPGGRQASQELAEALQPSATLCTYAISPSTQTVIQQADGLAKAGKKDQALDMLRYRLQEIIETVRHGRLALSPFQTKEWREAVRDILGMAEATYNLGGDYQPFHDAANQMVRTHAAQELADADLLGSLRIEEEAILFGIEDLEQMAHQRVNQIATEMIDAAIEDFDPCQADREAVVQLLNTAAKATLLGVEGLEPEEGRYEAVKVKAQQALAHQWNAYVRDRGLSANLLEDVPPCRVAGRLDIRVFSVCSQSWVMAGGIDFESVPDSSPVELSGSGQIKFAEQAVIGNELDCSIDVNAEVHLSGKLTNEAGVRSLELTPSYSDDGHYAIVGRTTPINDQGVYPFNGYGAFIMPWVEGSTHPSFGNTIVQYVLHITAEE